MINRLLDKRLAVFVLPAILMFFYLNAALHFRYTPDDTYIYLQYARNVLGGEGIAFNPGVPSYGVTGPAWMALIALGGALQVNLLVAAKLADLFLASMALMMFYFVAFEVMRNIFVSLLATLTFAINVWFLRWAGTGMETSFAVLVLLATFWFTLRNEYFIATVFTAILGLIRPEGWFLFPLILADVYVNSTSPGRAWKMIGALSLIFGALLAPWLVYAQVTFGAIVPNTALAKSTAGFDIGASLETLVDITKTLILSDGITGTVLVLGVLLLWWRNRAGRGPQTDAEGREEAAINFYMLRTSIVPLGWVIVVCALYCIRGVNVVSRYLLLVSPVLVIYAFFFFTRVVQFVPRKGMALIGAIILTAAVMLQNQVSYMLLVKPAIEQFQYGMETCFIPIGKWFNRSTEPGTVIFAPDIGALGYYSQRPICDAAGLVSNEPLAFLRNGGTMEEMYHQKLYRTWGAQYVVHRSRQPEALKDEPDLQPLFFRPMNQLDVAATGPMYYTVYKVLDPPLQGTH